VIYKILDATEWATAQAGGHVAGSADDRRDGFIHLSAADQVVETAHRHFADRSDLVLLTVDDAALGPHLRWEESRGGALFPHLYGPLPVTAVMASDRLRDDVPAADGISAVLRAGR
jgi:uncharacterized protein (DUF952 family)